MLSCFKCQTTLPDRGTFCPNCAIQVRCRSCRDLLLPDARVCVECRTPIGTDSPSQPVDGASTVKLNETTGIITRAVNTLEFEETPKRRYLVTRLTDEAINSLSNPLAAFMGGRAGTLGAKSRRSSNQDAALADSRQQSLLTDGYIDFNEQDQSDAIDVEPVVSDSSTSANTEEKKLRELFRYKDKTLKLIDSRLKASSQMDFVRRLTYLFLYAHELEGRETVIDKDLIAVLNDAKVLDAFGNARNWIKNSPELLIEGENVGLSVPGRERAREVIAQLLNNEIDGTWTLANLSRASGTKSSSATAKDGAQGSKSGQRKGGRASKVETEWLPKWKALKTNIDGQQLLKDRTSAQKGLFGLWAIRKAIGDDAGKIVSDDLLSKFLYQAFEIKVAARSLNRALKAKDMKDKVLHVGGTQFQIVSSGMKDAEQMANSARTVASSHNAPKPTTKK